MSNILSKILQTKRQEVDALLSRETLDSLKEKAKKADSSRGFAQALIQRIQSGQPAVIAEIKKASPSKGLIRADFNAAAIAQSYAKNGAACLSVLTDASYFQGGNEFLVAARAACNIPVLRKDFIVDVAQIYEARAIGADAILLIAAALTDDQMKEFEQVAMDLGMDVLVEVHDQGELTRALKLKTPLLGINNRDLKTFSVDLNRSLSLKSLVSKDKVVICESGIESCEDMANMMQGGIFGFLIGETFMRAKEPGQFLDQCLAALRKD